MKCNNAFACVSSVKDTRSDRLLAGSLGLLRGTELGLGYPVDPSQRRLVDTDVFADHLGRDAGIA